MKPSRIVITGVGLTAPNGNSLAEFRQNLLNGVAGIERMEIRYMGSQLAGGNDRQKKWIGCACQNFVQVPFPDGFKNPDTSFALFLKTLADKHVQPEDIAGVMSESFQGCGPDFFPVEYARKLEAFCRQHDIVLIMDEVQAGFCRSGRMFSFQHYGIQPDLIACGKGISSSLPMSAVIGRKDIMGIYAPGSMTSTHSASPLAVAAAIANLKILQGEKLAERATAMEMILMPALAMAMRAADASATRVRWAAS